MTILYTKARRGLDNLAQEFVSMERVLLETQEEYSKLKKDASTWHKLVEGFKEQLACVRENALYWEEQYQFMTDEIEENESDLIDANNTILSLDEALNRERKAHAQFRHVIDSNKSTAEHDCIVYKERWLKEARASHTNLKELTEANEHIKALETDAAIVRLGDHVEREHVINNLTHQLAEAREDTAKVEVLLGSSRSLRRNLEIRLTTMKYNVEAAICG